MGKSLWTDAGDGELIDLYEARTETDEADFVISAINQLSESSQGVGSTHG
jgi:DNA helicase-2/ATP-dependent DNA helicase PcrA